MTEHGLPADILAEIDADTARYRAGRIRAAIRRLNKKPKFDYIQFTFNDILTIARRYYKGESRAAISRSTGCADDLIWQSLYRLAKAYATQEETFRCFNSNATERLTWRELVGVCLERVDRNEPPLQSVDTLRHLRRRVPYGTRYVSALSICGESRA
jgi:hypothetical protein